MNKQEIKLVGALGFRVKECRLIAFNDEGMPVSTRPVSPQFQALWDMAATSRNADEFALSGQLE